MFFNPKSINETITSEQTHFYSVVEALKKNDVFICILSFDFTTLNILYGHEGANLIRDKALQFFESKLSKEILGKIQYYGGKILYFLHHEVPKQIWQEINTKIIKSKVRAFYKVEAKIRSIKIDENELKNLFINLARIEKKLKHLRGKIKAEFEKENFNIIPIKIDIEKELKKKNDLSKINIDFKDIRYSENLINAYSYLFGVNKNLDQAYFYLVNYLIYLYVQKLFFEIFKIEKVKHFMDTRKTFRKFKFDDINIIKTWFDATLKPLEPFMDEKSKNELNNIENLINHLLSIYNQNQDSLTNIGEKLIKSYERKLVQKINNFIENLNVIGTFSLPLNIIKITPKAYNFFRRQFFLKFGKENFEKKLKEITTTTLVKERFPYVAKSKEGFWYLFKLLNEPFKQKIAMVFLELDHFNAFNKFFFGNDSDKIYSEIINAIFEHAHDLIIKYKTLKTMTSYIMGDEFFFAFNYEEKKEEKEIKKIILDFSTIITKRLSHYKFPLTEKVKIKVKENAGREVVFRALVFNNQKIEFGKVGVSKVILYSIPPSQQYFYHAIEECDKLMDLVKKKNRGGLLEKRI